MNSALRSGVSVLIPAHNEEKYVAACIESVRANDWPADQLKIIVIDNRSTDGTADAARRAGAAVLNDRSTSIGAVRNAGLRAATREYVAYVDADCTVPRTWIRSGVELLAGDAGAGAIGGSCLSPPNGTWVERSIAPVTLGWQGRRPVESLATSSFIARTTQLRELGGFNESLTSGEDTEMSSRLQQRGLHLYSLSDCTVVHYGYPNTLRAFMRKQIWHGSSHLEAQTRVDLTLLLSHMSLAGLLLLALSVPLLLVSLPAALGSALFALLLLVLPPSAYAAKRAAQSTGPWPLQRWWLLGCAYFLGRARGLAQNYLRRFT